MVIRSRMRRTSGREKPTRLKRVQWYEDIEESPTELGTDAKVWKTEHKGFSIKVYPCKLINKNVDGWEYELWNEKKNVDWDSWFESSVGKDHAPDKETAMRWAINTVDEWK